MNKDTESEISWFLQASKGNKQMYLNEKAGGRISTVKETLRESLITQHDSLQSILHSTLKTGFKRR